MRRDANGITMGWQTEGEFRPPYSGVEACIHGLTVSLVWVDGEALGSPGQEFATGVFRELHILGQL